MGTVHLHDLLIWLLWLLAIGIAVAVAGWFFLKWAAFRVATHVATLAESQIAAAVHGELSRTGIEIRGVADPIRRARYVADINRVAWLMDRLIPIPVIFGKGGGIGLDPIIGLIPVVGDALGFAISAFVVIRAAQLGVPKELLSRLIAIQMTDFLLGVVPVAGDLLDAAYPANQKCARLIRDFVDSRR